jgi:hypothetical protein
MSLDDLTLAEKVAMLVRTLQLIDPLLDTDAAIDRAVGLVGDTCQLDSLGLTARSYTQWAVLIQKAKLDLARGARATWDEKNQAAKKRAQLDRMNNTQLQAAVLSLGVVGSAAAMSAALSKPTTRRERSSSPAGIFESLLGRKKK